VTINNPTKEDYDEIEHLKSQTWVKSWNGQLEEGADGTPHVQACLKTEYVRWGKVKNALTRAHIEKARNSQALSNYVVKEETRVGAVPAGANKYMNIQQFYTHLAEHVVCKIAAATNIDAFEVRLCLTGNGYKDHRDPVANAKKAIIPLNEVNAAAAKLIADGYMGLEFIVTNPATKTMFKTFFWSVIERAYNRD